MYEPPADAFVADFIGSSFLIPLDQAECCDVDRSVFGPLIDNPTSTLVVRPEKLDIAADDERQPGHFYFCTRVLETVYQGDAKLVHARLIGGGTIVVRRDSRNASLRTIPPVGASRRLALHQSDASLVPLESRPAVA